MQSTKEAELLTEEEVLPPARLAALFPAAELRDTLLRNGVLVPDKNGALRVRFVGVAVAGGRSFQVLPKIFSVSSTNVATTMRQVVRALRRHARWQPQRQDEVPFLDPTATNTELNALAIADWLIRDYLSAGIYRRLRDREEISGSGQISWRRTIERMTPIMSAGRPVYVDTVTRSIARDRDYFVSRLHRQIVESSARSFGHLLGYAPLNLGHEPFEPFGEMPALSLCQARIRQEMREAFSDRAMQLLPMLLAWLTAIDKAESAGLALYGTTSFYDVWEKACALALGNERDQWQIHIPRPKWRSADGREQEADTFEPDIVTRIKDDFGEHLLIADAKYYRLAMPPLLQGQPGVNDVAKQLWYQRCLADAARDRGLDRTYNIFVVPGPEHEEGFWSDGQVDLAGLPETTVKVKRLSGLLALERYADGAALDQARVRAVIFAP
ncbi:LlaJI family restriction endonuclease [Glacieibacterium megasporae]|uniref:LlaJI family restriction endonuclease n=1 Tax=Glacieibacterium megasporae TaxID=2835787 RepID=UPI001C1E4D1D|nr:LlaJI family restriction endonuclease [Polymorphobacter megasporae]UAJ10051.1 LlaJI family restriction endonuclease [Polymorphobacter megasporae]